MMEEIVPPVATPEPLKAKPAPLTTTLVPEGLVKTMVVAVVDDRMAPA